MVVKLGHPPGTPPAYRDEGAGKHLRHAYDSLDTPVRLSLLRELRERLPLLQVDPLYVTTAELGDLL
jgi:hypothetical protein